MARGQLGDIILAHFRENPDDQTIKQVKDALGTSSAGAIGYALDKLAGEGKMVKLEGRPARYRPSSATQGVFEDDGTHGDEHEEKEPPKPAPVGKHGGSRPCGFCSTSQPRSYHERNCPATRGLVYAGKPYGCACADNDHNCASDYEEEERRDEAPSQSN